MGYLNKHTFNISQAAEDLVPDKFNRNAYITAVIIGIGLATVSIYFYPKLPDQIPVLITKPWGEGRLAAKATVFGASVVVLLISGLNIFMGKLWSGGVLVPKILSITAIVVSLAMCLALWGLLQAFFI